jgi:hypothetical protein
MALTDLLTQVRALPREEQLRLARTILAECEPLEALGLIPGKEYPILTPFYDCPGASDVLLRLLEEHWVKG